MKTALQEELKGFFQEVSSNPNREIWDDLSASTDRTTLCSRVVEHGQRLGYSFTANDLQEHLSTVTDRELSESELHMASGGDGDEMESFWCTTQKAISMFGTCGGS